MHKLQQHAWLNAELMETKLTAYTPSTQLLICLGIWPSVLEHRNLCFVGVGTEGVGCTLSCGRSVAQQGPGAVKGVRGEPSREDKAEVEGRENGAEERRHSQIKNPTPGDQGMS